MLFDFVISKIMVIFGHIEVKLKYHIYEDIQKIRQEHVGGV